jgi:trehalose monomycolate/heme transporter
VFALWGATAYRHRILVVALVALAVTAGGTWGLGVFDRLGQGGYDDPGSQATQAQQVGQAAMTDQSADVAVLYTAPPGKTVDDPGMRSAINAQLGTLPRDMVTQVSSYWCLWCASAPELASQDKRIGMATVGLAGNDPNAKLRSYDRISGQLAVRGVRTQVAGEIPMQSSMQERSKQDLTRAEAVSLPLVLVLLVLIFGAVVAASLPVIVGGLAVFGSLGLLHAISLFTTVNVFAVNVASLLGLGLAIDYGLFIVGRFREELDRGRSGPDAVRGTIANAGRTVAFSSTLLIMAMAGLLLFPQDFLRSLAYGGMSAVALAAVISLTLLPALLGLLGRRVNTLALPWYRGTTADTGRGWRGLANGVMKRPFLVAVPIVVALTVLGLPFTNIKFGTPDESMLPANDPARQAVEALNREFPAMSDNNMQVVLRGNGGAPPSPPEIERFQAAAGHSPGVRDIQPQGAKGNVVVLGATLTGDTFGDQSTRAVQNIRALTPPSNTQVLVGGPTALNVDSLHATGARLPWMALLIVAATFVLMLLAFGSVLLPIKAVVASALSLSATFGVLTWIFVEGHGAGLVGVTPSPLDDGVVVLMASVVFGLSTDYEAFLLSRMVEARADGAGTAEAVRTGLARTGRVITAAALLLIVVTGAFASSGIAMMRFIGVGMVLALALDATVVRMLLVPAVLRLLGDAAWWAPLASRRRNRGVPARPWIAGPTQPIPPVETANETTRRIPPVETANETTRRIPPVANPNEPTQRLQRVTNAR